MKYNNISTEFEARSEIKKVFKWGKAFSRFTRFYMFKKIEKYTPNLQKDLEYKHMKENYQIKHAHMSFLNDLGKDISKAINI